MNKTILITGGAGFIGSHLIDSLIIQNNRVLCLDNFDGFYPRYTKEENIKSALSSPLFTLIEGDLRNRTLLKEIFNKYSIDIVIHLAAKAGVRPSINNPGDYFDVNVNGTISLLEVMKDHNVKNLIFSSSSSIYGNNRKVPYSESDNVDFPISPYAASKKSAEMFVYTYHHLYNLNSIVLRFFTVYGPRQRPDLAIHKFFKKLYNNEAIDVYGDGSTSRDYTYIEDIVQGLEKAIQVLLSNNNIYEIVNLGNSNPIKLNELIGLIENVSQKKFKVNNLPMQIGDVDKTYADITKANSLLNYDPQTNILDGIKKFKEWYEANHV